MAIHRQDFPFEEIKDKNGDYFNTAQDVMNEGHSLSQVWSVVEGEDGDNDVLSYGPYHHRINVLGFIATKEHHDMDTYYEEMV